MALKSRTDAERFLAERHRGVLVTLKRSDGRPQVSNIVYALIDGHVRISVTDTRAKVANLRHDPRVSLYVTSEDFWTYVVAEGTAELSPVAKESGDEVCQALLELYETVRGEPHPDPGEFYQAMVGDRRLLLSIAVERLYPTGG
ncbi:MAG: PPOX class F420-dependent oxidoreductase [Egibacteraceae bacterium]